MRNVLIPDIERALQALGEQLARQGERAGIVILGGAALNLLGIVDRATRDVDVIALGVQPPPGTAPQLERPAELPQVLQAAIAKPTREELHAAAEWVRTQDASPEFARIVERVVEYVERHAQ